jgi:hypothetical protein
MYGQPQMNKKYLHIIFVEATWAKLTRIVREPHCDQPRSRIFRPKKFRGLWDGKFVKTLTLAKQTPNYYFTVYRHIFPVLSLLKMGWARQTECTYVFIV